MKLFTCRGAPHAIRVRLYLAEKTSLGIPISCDFVEIDLKGGEHRAPAHVARNSAGTVPVLQVEPDIHLGESLAIIEYFEDRYPHPSMWGTGSLDRARQREWDRIAELRILRPLAQWVHATNSPLGRSPDPQLAAHSAGLAGLGLTQIEAVFADGREFLGRELPSVADCTLAAGLDFALKRGFRLDPVLARTDAWRRRFWARSSASVHLRHHPS
jgi:glutathione S-transferase